MSLYWIVCQERSMGEKNQHIVRSINSYLETEKENEKLDSFKFFHFDILKKNFPTRLRQRVENFFYKKNLQNLETLIEKSCI